MLFRSKAAGLIIDDFRNGRIGRVTLEFPVFEEETSKEVDTDKKED